MNIYRRENSDKLSSQERSNTARDGLKEPRGGAAVDRFMLRSISVGLGISEVKVVSLLEKHSVDELLKRVKTRNELVLPLAGELRISEESIAELLKNYSPKELREISAIAAREGLGIEEAIRLDMKLDSEGSQSSRMDTLRFLCPAMASIRRIVSSYLSQRSAEDESSLEDRGSNVGTQLVKRTVSKSGRLKLKDLEKRLLELEEDEMEEVEEKGRELKKEYGSIMQSLTPELFAEIFMMLGCDEARVDAYVDHMENNFMILQGSDIASELEEAAKQIE
jgi:hypothetical protein